MLIVVTVGVLLTGVWKFWGAQYEKGRRRIGPQNYPIYGIDLSKCKHPNAAAIQSKLLHLKSLPFPVWASDDALSNWQTKLVESDDYLMRLVFKVLDGEKHDSNELTDNLRELRVGLEIVDGLSTEDRAIRTKCETYLKGLEDLAQSMHR